MNMSDFLLEDESYVSSLHTSSALFDILAEPAPKDAQIEQFPTDIAVPAGGSDNDVALAA